MKISMDMHACWILTFSFKYLNSKSVTYRIAMSYSGFQIGLQGGGRAKYVLCPRESQKLGGVCAGPNR
jgi:hypothetical protein